MILPKAPPKSFLLSKANGQRGTLELDRIDNDKGYKPGNIRWATRTEQTNNTRVSVKIGPHTSIAEAMRVLGLDKETIVRWKSSGTPYAELLARRDYLLRMRQPIGAYKNTKEVAKALGVHPVSIRNWRRAGFTFKQMKAKAKAAKQKIAKQHVIQIGPYASVTEASRGIAVKIDTIIKWVDAGLSYEDMLARKQYLINRSKPIGPYADTTEAAAVFGVSQVTVRNWRNLGLSYKQMKSKAERLRDRRSERQ